MEPIRVSMGRCGDYGACGDHIEEALEATGLATLLSGRRVLLKPNLMKGAAPERCLNTHPAFVGALTGALVARGCEVVVAESSGLLGLTAEVFLASGVQAATEEAGGTVVNLDAGPFERLTLGDGTHAHRIWVPRQLFEVDAVVSVPKLKTHQLTVMSAATKNLVGLLPGATKCALHLLAPGRAAFAGRLLDLLVALRAAGVTSLVGIVDGIWGLAGQGSRGGARRQESGVVLAGNHLLALDWACAEQIGIPPREVPLLRLARERGLLADPTAWDVEHLRRDRDGGETTPYPRAVPDATQRLAPVTAGYYWLRGHTVGVSVDPERCCLNLRCREICPVDCISVRAGRIRIGRSCIRCYACVSRCPSGAVGLSVARPLRPLLRRRAAGLTLPELR